MSTYMHTRCDSLPLLERVCLVSGGVAWSWTCCHCKLWGPDLANWDPPRGSKQNKVLQHDMGAGARLRVPACMISLKRHPRR